jgi:hypothetical protein
MNLLRNEDNSSMFDLDHSNGENDQAEAPTQKQF